jgi:hypothetical protein
LLPLARLLSTGKIVDVLTSEQLSDIAQEWMQKMGYGDQPFIVYLHEDIERRHIHIVSLRVDENGKKIDDRFEHRRSMDACRELEPKYGLVPADQKKRQEGVPLKPVSYEDGDVKHQIANVIRPIAQLWHFQSLKEYKALLTLYNTGMEEVRGEINGKPYQGLVYFALDSRGEKVGNPFKSSLFGKSVGVEGLKKRIEKSAEIIKNKGLKERSKKVISIAMQTCKNRENFEKILENRAFPCCSASMTKDVFTAQPLLTMNKRFNGSRLGKEFSANVFNDLFNGKNSVHDLPDNGINPKPELESGQSLNRENHSSDIGGIFDIFTPKTGSYNADDMAEEAFTRRMKKRRKRHI